ncbi:MAG: sulfatase [Planctomycetes bacterium]|nr:sulfatase [Planctomycetota bacterium]
MAPGMDRRQFVAMLGGAAIAGGLGAFGGVARAGGDRPNILLITADDLNWDCTGYNGCPLPGVTPHLDKLASEGMRFERMHVTSPVCQPSRQTLLTGLYPHNNGGRGFLPIKKGVKTLPALLRKAGYRNYVLSKVDHMAPEKAFAWDKTVDTDDLRHGRDPKRYYEKVRDCIKDARGDKKPFFIVANSNDPHRPFAGSEDEERKIGKNRFPDPPKTFRAADVPVPGFLPDVPNVRKEVAQYLGSVSRLDATAGQVLKALKESGQDANTIVIFLSDHGMPFPFAKTTCYRAGTRTPMLVRWPDRIKPGSTDAEHFISGIDFMPTLLEAAGLPVPEDLDGRSFLPVLGGEKQADRTWAMTVVEKTSRQEPFPTRAIQDARYAYLFNSWPDGKTKFLNESMSGLTFKAMEKAAETDEQLAARVKHFRYREVEEFYDLESDPHSLKNLFGDPKHDAEIKRLKTTLRQEMERSKDPELSAFDAMAAK